MSMEVALFDLNHVAISDERLSLGRHSFPLDSILDVEVQYRHRSWMPVVSLLVGALGLEVLGHSFNQPGLEMAAVAFLMVAATIFWKGGPRYAIAVDTPQGKMISQSSSDRFFVEGLGQLMQRSMGETTPRRRYAAHARPVLRRLPVKNQVASYVGRGQHQSGHARLFTMAARTTPTSVI